MAQGLRKVADLGALDTAPSVILGVSDEIDAWDKAPSVILVPVDCPSSGLRCSGLGPYLYLGYEV